MRRRLDLPGWLALRYAAGKPLRIGQVWQDHRFALGIGLLAFFVYMSTIGWGVPHATAPDRTKTFATDEILPLEGLAEMHNTFVVSKPTRNYGYPWWHYFVVAMAQTPYLLYLVLSDGLQSASPEYPFGLADPVASLRALTLIGRSVSALMGAGVVVAAYYFSRVLWGHLAGIITALLTMLNFLMLYYSGTGNLDVPVFFWTSIGLVIFARILVDGMTVRRGAWLGVFAGLSMATKDQALVFFLPFACVLLLPPFNAKAGSKYQLKPALLALVASIVAYLVGTGMFVDPHRHATHVYRLLFDSDRLSTGRLYHQPHPQTWQGTVGLLVDHARDVVATMSVPVVVTSLAGILLVCRTFTRHAVLLLPLGALFLMVLWPTGFAIRRYLLPFTLIFDGFAAYAIVALRRSSFRPVWVPLLVVLIGWRLLVGADLAYAQFNDTRYTASAWLKSQARPGDRVEFFGIAEKIPHLPATIESRRVANRTEWKGQFDHGPFVLDYLAEQGPEFLLIIPDATSRRGMNHSGDCPPSVYDALIEGTAGYTQVAYFPPRSLPLSPLRRPHLDNPSVCPPVRVLARNDVAKRLANKLKPSEMRHTIEIEG